MFKSWTLGKIAGIQINVHGTFLLLLGFILLSEMNKEGRAKGRALDHRCDFALAMESSDEDNHAHIKAIRMTKNWHGPTGRLGDFALYWQLGRLARISDGGEE